MHKYVFFNSEITGAANTSISAAASAALYGRGIFTTVAVYDAKPFLWEKHWRRLLDDAEKTGISFTEYDEETIKQALVEIIAANNATNARARLTFFDETTGGMWSFPGKQRTGFLIMTAERREISADYRLTVSPFRINSASPLAGVKSCNYLEKLLASEEAKKRGFNEALLTNERGEIVSACMANVFWTKHGELFTPSLETGCLAGTTREFLLEKLNCRETRAAPEVLREADAIFLTSAGIGVVRVGEYENRKYESKYDEIVNLIPQN